AAVFRGWLARPPEGERAAARSARRIAWSALAATAALLWAMSGLSKDALVEARASAVAGDHAAALAAGVRAQRLAPRSPRAAAFAAGARLAGGGSEAGEAAAPDAERAVALAPSRASARALRAGIRARAGDAPGAYADFASAAKLYPLHSEYAEQRDALAGEIG